MEHVGVGVAWSILLGLFIWGAWRNFLEARKKFILGKIEVQYSGANGLKSGAVDLKAEMQKLSGWVNTQNAAVHRDAGYAYALAAFAAFVSLAIEVFGWQHDHEKEAAAFRVERAAPALPAVIAPVAPQASAMIAAPLAASPPVAASGGAAHVGALVAASVATSASTASSHAASAAHSSSARHSTAAKPAALTSSGSASNARAPAAKGAASAAPAQSSASS
jgi:hypothetical protein